MDLHEALDTLKHSDCKPAKDCFLAHAFVMCDAGGKEEWQLGFFSEKDDRMHSFIIADKVVELPPAEVLKTGSPITELKPAHVRLAPAKALEIAQDACKQHYGTLIPIKTFYIIQEIEGRAIYNVTIITKNFTTVNVRIDAKDGAVVKHSNEPLVSFG